MRICARRIGIELLVRSRDCTMRHALIGCGVSAVLLLVIAVGFAQPPAAPVPPPHAVAAATRLPETGVDDSELPGRFLGTIEQQNRLITAQVKAEVEHSLRDARALMSA